MLPAARQWIARMAAFAVEMDLDIRHARVQHGGVILDRPHRVNLIAGPPPAMNDGGVFFGMGGAVRPRAKGDGPG